MSVHVQLPTVTLSDPEHINLLLKCESTRQLLVTHKLYHQSMHEFHNEPEIYDLKDEGTEFKLTSTTLRDHIYYDGNEYHKESNVVL